MSKERLFLDTAFIQAILNKRDQYHRQAVELLPFVKTAAEVWTTEAIFLEVGNALSSFNRQQVANFIQQCYQTENMRVVNINSQLFAQGLTLFASRLDQSWGLVDCLSFVVMKQQNLTSALTSDRHFRQAGFQILLS